MLISNLIVLPDSQVLFVSSNSKTLLEHLVSSPKNLPYDPPQVAIFGNNDLVPSLRSRLISSEIDEDVVSMGLKACLILDVPLSQAVDSIILFIGNPRKLLASSS
ncbi:hypothetical protein ACFE04_006212 [Oxalis oulophora]